MHFNPLPPRGGRLFGERIGGRKSIFQSTPSSRRETRARAGADARRAEFQSTPSSRRETAHIVRRQVVKSYFNPLPPRGGRHAQGVGHGRRDDFNPLPPRGGRQCAPCSTLRMAKISIHSLLAEGDLIKYGAGMRGMKDFNPLPPRGGRPAPYLLTSEKNHFNPLPPRGGRRARRSAARRHEDFNPLPPRGGRHALLHGVSYGY